MNTIKINHSLIGSHIPESSHGWYGICTDQTILKLCWSKLSCPKMMPWKAGPTGPCKFGINSFDFRAVILVFQGSGPVIKGCSNKPGPDTLELSHLHFFHPPVKKKGPTNESFRIVCSNEFGLHEFGRTQCSISFFWVTFWFNDPAVDI